MHLLSNSKIRFCAYLGEIELEGSFRILSRHNRFASFHGTSGGLWYEPPLAVSSLIELELRGKKRACCSPRDEAIDV